MRRGEGGGDGPTLPASRHTRRLVCRARGDEGFVLLESIVSISLITVIMTALTSLFVTVIRVDNEQRSRQVAVQVADSTASLVRRLPASDLLPGRTAAAVDTQWNGASADVADHYLPAMEKATGLAVLPPSLPPLPPTPTTQVVQGVSYTVNVYLGWCHTVAGATATTACTKPVAPVTHDQLRAVIEVAWGDRHCGRLNLTNATPTCVYVGATLISFLGDPVFNLKQPAPPLPMIKLPSFVGYAVGDAIGPVPPVQMDVEPNTGVPPLTWALTSGTWPEGVSMSTTGLVTGTITKKPPGQIAVSVTDGFLRTVVSALFTWSVADQLVGNVPAPRDDVLGTPIPILTLTATGGALAPYTWSDPTGTLPPGLILSPTGVVSGTPTAVAPSYPATYAVVLTAADKSVTRKTTVAFTWTIRYAPLVVTNLGARTDPVNRSITPLQLTAIGGKSPYAWSSTPLPLGLTLSGTTGLISGTPTAAGTTSVTVTATDGQPTSATATFTWTVAAGPSVTTPVPAPAPVGTFLSLAVSSGCPRPSCIYSAANLPPGLSINTSTGTISGTPNTAGTFINITVTITDADKIPATSNPFSWVITTPPKPTIASPGDLISQVASPVKITLTPTTCAAGPCVYALINGPSGVSIDRNGLMTATGIGGGVNIYTTTMITVTDVNGASATSLAFKWTVGDRGRFGFIRATWPVFTSTGGMPDQPLAYFCFSFSSCTITVTGQPSGVGLSRTANDVAATHPTSLTVPAFDSGTLWLSGTVTAPPGTPTTVTLTISGAADADSGIWTVR